MDSSNTMRETIVPNIPPQTTSDVKTGTGSYGDGDIGGNGDGETMDGRTDDEKDDPNDDNDNANVYHVLVEFVYKHLDFQLAELESILGMYGIQVGSSNCKIRPLPVPMARAKDDDGLDSRYGPLSSRRSFCLLEFPIDYAERLADRYTTTRRRKVAPTTAKKGCHNNDDDDSPAKAPHHHSPEFDPTVHIPSNFRSSHNTIGKDFGGLPGIAEMLSKCTLVKSVIELWSYSTISLEDCAERAHRWFHRPSSASIKKQMCHPSSSEEAKNDDDKGQQPQQHTWKFTVQTLGTKFTRTEQDIMRGTFSPILDMIYGPVQLLNPTNELFLIREIELDGKGSPIVVAVPPHQRGIPPSGTSSPSSSSSSSSSSIGADDATDPQQEQQQNKSEQGTTQSPSHPFVTDAPPALAYYFGRVLGGTPKDSRGVDRFALKRRPYLGPTSMDAELSFVMTSLGQVHTGTIVYDPFVGTGSILLACALRGAYCVGSDIDIRVLKGKGDNETIWKNFEHYNLPRPEIIRTDNSLYRKHFRHSRHPTSIASTASTTTTTSTLYDAILCDPPYGIRAGARKTGSKLEQPRPVLDEHRHDHIAQTRVYSVSDVMSDLLDVAAQTLNMGGRLVYVIPSFQDFDPTRDLPRHDCLELIHCCYQPFTGELGRRIVSMQKIVEYDTSKQGEYLSTIWLYGQESAEKCANIRDKIIEAAKLKPDYERRLAVRREKRKAHKVAKKHEKNSNGNINCNNTSSSNKRSKGGGFSVDLESGE
jgi:tRNA (guanine10-N2)-methyltransferase